FGAVFQSQAANTSNTLFGDLAMPEIVPPKLATCAPWQLIEQLDFEKEVTGMYMSGHPLDNFKFELKHYNFTPLNEFNEIKNAVDVSPTTKTMRMAGLVIDAQHRLTKNGKNFGVLHLEDFSGKAEFMLWSEDYAKYSHYLDKGMILMVEGAFKQRYNSNVYSFNLSKLHLLETVKSTMTKQVTIDIAAENVDTQFVDFIDNNVKTHPGNTKLIFQINDPAQNLKIMMSTLEMGFTMNDEMAYFLNKNSNVDISVGLV
ncbi:MAG: DNA polymerase III subunit alpha, partial [Bacteroidetes bacterium]|nr:DNA polymerase III subunit alpha [Bacteroidota bacterium]